MGFMRKIGREALGALLVLGSGVAAAAPPEPLIVTQLADPDPDYVPSSNALKLKSSTISTDRSQENPTLDQAMEDFGRAVGEAARLQQQTIEAQCRSAGTPPTRAAERWAWEANCRYQRY